MAIPKYNEFYGSILNELADGDVHTFKDIKSNIARLYNITDEERAEMLPSGGQKVFDNRVGWARTYLKKAGLIDSPSRGQCVLTDKGKAALPDADHIDNDYLMRYDSFCSFAKTKSKVTLNNTQEDESDKSPEEILEDAFKAINESLADDLMSEVMKLTPTDFERFVVELLKKMGYGGGVEDSASVTPASNDGGIDGIIKEDQLGFSSIYIQAKQWAVDRTVDRPSIDTFIGALTRNHANKGLFITTASFSSGAREAAKAANIVLVDGRLLTKLMIKYNLGVSVEHVYEVKRIDSDFFIEGF